MALQAGKFALLAASACGASQGCLQSPSKEAPTQVAFVIGGLRRQTSTLKPFNPILGETYQGQYSSGLRVYAEQISHHPPVSSWQVEDAKGRVSPHPAVA